MKIKALVLASALLLCGSAFAQETNRDANGKLQYGSYETNKFWDNWFVEAGAGINVGFNGLANKIFKGGDNLVGGTGFGTKVEVGKWIDPCWGVGLGWNGLKTGDFIPTADHKLGTPNQIWNNYVHGDVFVNFSNLVAGYKETRLVNFIPYFNAGLMFTKSVESGEKANKPVAFGFGMMVPFRICNSFSIVPDFGLAYSSGEFYNIDVRRAKHFSAILALQYNFGRNNWTRKATTTAAAAAALAASEAARAAIQAKNDKLAASEADAQKAKDQLAKENKELQDELARAAANAGNAAIDLAETPIIAYFEIGKTTLSEKELAHVEYNVKTAIAQNKNVKLTIAGNADTKTGTAKRNQYLSEKRAEYIYNLLTEKYGLDGSNFTVKANGGNDIFATPALNRATIISK